MPRARPQAKATTRPQQWLKASPRPQQWLVIGVQGCRLTGFKPLQPLKCLAGRLPAERSVVRASMPRARPQAKATTRPQPIRSHCCGRGDALSHCCGLVVAFACGRARGMDALTTERYAGKRPARHFKGFIRFEVWSLSNGSLERL